MKTITLLTLAAALSLAGCPKGDNGKAKTKATPKAKEAPKQKARAADNTAASPAAAVAPKMPASWKVQKDVALPPATVAAIGKRLGGALSALRNTIYTVDGQRVQLNTIVAASTSDADAIVASLAKMKSKEAFLRRGNVVYEWVGNNAALPAIRAGRAHVAASR